MSNIKKFNLFNSFNESYSDDLSEILENDENLYIIMKGDDIIAGFEFISDCFDHLSELLEGDGAITEEQKYEFDEYISQSNVEGLYDQFEIEEFMVELLDKFEIVEPYKIIKREELEDTPDDDSVDTDTDTDMSDDEFDMNEYESNDDGDDNDIDDNEYDKFLGESLNNNNSICIVGDKDGKTEEIDDFESTEEATEFLDDYKKIYSEFNNIRIAPRFTNENINTNRQERSLANKDLDDDMVEWANEEPKYNPNSKCKCDGNCKCTKGCTCDNCVEKRKKENGGALSEKTTYRSKSKIKTFSNFKKK